MDKEKIDDKKQQERIISDGIEHSFNAASTGDCTGLIPSGNVEGAELESYKEIYDFGTPEFANVPDSQIPHGNQKARPSSFK